MENLNRQKFSLLYSGDPMLNFNAVEYFRMVLSRTADEGSCALSQSIKAAMVPKLIQFLDRYDQPSIQLESAWALTNIACGSEEEVWLLVAAGAAKKLQELASMSANAGIRDQAIWALSNIAGDNHQSRESLLASGTLEVCLANLNSLPASGGTSKICQSRRNLVWALCNLCRSRSSSAYHYNKFAPAMTALCHMLLLAPNLNDDDLVTEACWALAYLMDGHDNWLPIEQCLTSGAVTSLVHVLANKNCDRVLSAVVRAVGNVVTGTVEQTQAILDAGVLPYLTNLLDSGKESLVREVCWVLSNIAAGSEAQVQTVANCSGLLKKLVLITGGHESNRVRREAAWVLCNALTGGQDEVKKIIVEHGCIPPLTRLLNGGSDSRFLEALLAAVEAVFRLGKEREKLSFGNNNYASMFLEHGGLSRLRQVGQDESCSHSVRNISNDIITDFFSVESSNKCGDNPLIIHFVRKPRLC